MNVSMQDYAGGDFFSGSNVRRLVVLLHAYGMKKSSTFRAYTLIREVYPDADVFAPNMPMDQLSLANPLMIARDVTTHIRAFDAAQQYDEIILVGHSAGAILARKVWILAHGMPEDLQGDPVSPEPWAKKITRIILVAALSRGWQATSALTPQHRALWAAGTVWGNLCRHVLRRDPLIFEFRRGAVFLTVARLQSLALEAHLKRTAQSLPIVVQMLGSEDDYIAPTDNLDLAVGRAFYYLEVRRATHAGIIEFDLGPAGRPAAKQFRLALRGSPAELQAASLHVEDVFDLSVENADDHDDEMMPIVYPAVRHVVFVIHGIRDKGFWTRRIARAIKTAARTANQECRTITSTYGYFPMGPFLLPWERRLKTEWLLDQYVAAKSLYPNAEFSYVGHSNGTFLVTDALEICSAVSFNTVVLAGSVVRTKFPWETYLSGKVRKVVNFVGGDDWVVAIFPQGLERLGLPGLGGAGHLGFSGPASVVNSRYVLGGHGGALVEEKWEEIANIVVNDAVPAAGVRNQNKIVSALGLAAPVLWVVGVIVLGAAFLALVLWNASPVSLLAIALYCVALWVVLTRL